MYLYLGCCRRKSEILLLPWRGRFCCCCAKTLTFCYISVNTKDIYLDPGVCVHYPKSNPYYQGRQFKMHFFFFFQNYASFFDFDFLSSIKQTTPPPPPPAECLHHMRCSCSSPSRVFATTCHALVHDCYHPFGELDTNLG